MPGLIAVMSRSEKKAGLAGPQGRLSPDVGAVWILSKISFAAPQKAASQQMDNDSYKFKKSLACTLHGSGAGRLRHSRSAGDAHFPDEACAADEARAAYAHCGEEGRAGGSGLESGLGQVRGGGAPAGYAVGQSGARCAALLPAFRHDGRGG